MLATVQKSIKAHGSLNSDDLGEIYQLIKYNDYIVSLALDNGLKIWNRNLQLISSHIIHGYYQISLAYFQDKFYIGDGDGNIMVYNDKIQYQRTINICNDFVADIKIVNGILIAVAYDGTILLIDLTDNSTKKIQVVGQLYQIQQFGNDYYIAGTKSYKISHDLSVIQEINRFQRLLSASGQLYGIQDDGQFSTVFKPINPNQSQAYDTLVAVGNHIVAISDNKITSFSSVLSGFYSWKTQLIRDFKEGYQKRAAVAFGNQLFVGSDQGKIYKILLHDS